MTIVYTGIERKLIRRVSRLLCFLCIVVEGFLLYFLLNRGWQFSLGRFATQNFSRSSIWMQHDHEVDKINTHSTLDHHCAARIWYSTVFLQQAFSMVRGFALSIFGSHPMTEDYHPAGTLRSISQNARSVPLCSIVSSLRRASDVIDTSPSTDRFRRRHDLRKERWFDELFIYLLAETASGVHRASSSQPMAFYNSKQLVDVGCETTHLSRLANRRSPFQCFEFSLQPHELLYILYIYLRFDPGEMRRSRVHKRLFF